MEKTINDLIDLVTDNEISDIFVHGYIEKNNDILSFHPMMDRIYIEMGNKFIEIDNDQDNFYMYIDVVHEMNPCFELDDGDELGISSLLSLLIRYMISELNIVELNLYDVSDLGGKLILAVNFFVIPYKAFSSSQDFLQQELFCLDFITPILFFILPTFFGKSEYNACHNSQYTKICRNQIEMANTPLGVFYNYMIFFA